MTLAEVHVKWSVILADRDLDYVSNKGTSFASCAFTFEASWLVASFVFSRDLILSPDGTRPRPELLFYTSDVSCITDVIVRKFLALTSKGT